MSESKYTTKLYTETIIYGIISFITFFIMGYNIASLYFNFSDLFFVFACWLSFFASSIVSVLFREFRKETIFETNTPFYWFISSSLFALLLNLINISSFLGVGSILVTIFIFLLPYIVYAIDPSLLIGSISSISDQEVLKIVKKYGGIVTKSVIVYESNIPLEEASKCLDRFCKYGEAIKKVLGNIIIYDFPSIRAYLSHVDNRIIELLLKNYTGMSKADMLKATGYSIETLEESLKRLETKGIIQYDKISNEYKLTGISI